MTPSSCDRTLCNSIATHTVNRFDISFLLIRLPCSVTTNCFPKETEGPLVLQSNIHTAFNPQTVGSKWVRVNSPRKKIRLSPVFFHVMLLLAIHCVKYFLGANAEKKTRIKSPKFLSPVNSPASTNKIVNDYTLLSLWCLGYVYIPYLSFSKRYKSMVCTRFEL